MVLAGRYENLVTVFFVLLSFVEVRKIGLVIASHPKTVVPTAVRTALWGIIKLLYSFGLLVIVGEDSMKVFF